MSLLSTSGIYLPCNLTRQMFIYRLVREGGGGGGAFSDPNACLYGVILFAA